MISRGEDGFYHPKNEGEIIQLIHHANREEVKLRVRGSAHSVPAAIYAGDLSEKSHGEGHINISLDQMNQISFDEARMQVTAQAGIHLGHHIDDPTETSTLENSLLYQLDNMGWALPITGGIIRQSVGGFLSSGSAGGSLKYQFGDAVAAIRMIDGNGNVQEFTRTNDLDDPFYAAALSMGLLGVITAVTFQCIPKFYIFGQESTTKYADCEFNLLGTGDGVGRPDLVTFFKDIGYGRCMWWPQKGIEKIVVWQARRLEDPPWDFKPKPYHEFPKLLGSTRPAQQFAGFFFREISRLNPPGPKTILGKLFNKLLKPIYVLVVNAFVTNGSLGPQKFWDTWWSGIPMDNRVDFKLLPLEFSELWFPLEKSQEVIMRLHKFFAENGLDRTGTFAVEIYPAPANDFWMSPSYQQDMMRFDLIWFRENKGDPARDFYPRFWDLLKNLNFRMHWGKYVVDDPEYLRRLQPRWDDFMRLRAEMDPNQIFVTDYWREALGIAPNVPADRGM